MLLAASGAEIGTGGSSCNGRGGRVLASCILPMVRNVAGDDAYADRDAAVPDECCTAAVASACTAAC